MQNLLVPSPPNVPFTRFYPILDQANWLREILPCGVQCVQLRLKNLSQPALREQIADAKRLCADYGAQLIVNDYWELALELGCDFIHLGQEDLDSADLSSIKKGNLKLGISTHDSRELERALSLSPTYIALGPIYPTTSKPMSFAPQGLERIKMWKQAMGSIPLIAIGGITLERAEAVFDAGADSIAVISDVLGHPQPAQRCRAWMAATALFQRGAE